MDGGLALLRRVVRIVLRITADVRRCGRGGAESARLQIVVVRPYHDPQQRKIGRYELVSEVGESILRCLT
jgi:hypothetical protein